MKWQEYYSEYFDLSDKQRRLKAEELEGEVKGEELVEAILYTDNEKLKVLLLRKAMLLSAVFTREDLINLEDEVPDFIYKELGKYSGFDIYDPLFDEDDMDWEDFYGAIEGRDEELLIKRINKLKDFGASEEVCDALMSMPTSECEDLLFERAVSFGVRFKKEELESMGRENEYNIMEKKNNISEKPSVNKVKKPSKEAFKYEAFENKIDLLRDYGVRKDPVKGESEEKPLKEKSKEKASGCCILSLILFPIMLILNIAKRYK